MPENIFQAGWHISFTVRNWVRALNQLHASPDQLSALRSFVWIPLWHPGQFLARVQAGSEYKMTTSAVSFLSAVFFFRRLKGVGRVQPVCSLRVLSPLVTWFPVGSDLPSQETWKESEQKLFSSKEHVCAVTKLHQWLS